MRVGFLYDFLGVNGGAELSMLAFMRSAPPDVTVVDCPPGRTLPDCDAYVIGNCIQYHAWITKHLDGKPVVKVCFDIWKFADDGLRAWLLANATPILVSPELEKRVDWRFVKPAHYIPCPVDLPRFEAARNGHARAGAVWLGRLFKSKGLEAAAQWAKTNGVPLDFYGIGADIPQDNYKGVVAADDVPATLAKYHYFVFLPTEFDPCPRSVIEAWAAGCDLVLNGNQGTSWWLQHKPDALRTAAADFWQVVNHAA